MTKLRMSFSLGAVGICRGDGAAFPPPPSGGAVMQMPSDYADRVCGKGDRFRDAFTRACLYLSSVHIPVKPAAESAVVMGTEYGNLEAMLRLQQQARGEGGTISAQQFPHATTSSAATFVNIAHGITDANVTLNAGSHTPVMALLHALLHLRANPSGVSHLFVGDTYCDVAIEDVMKKARPGMAITPAVTYAELNGGTGLYATFRFDVGDHPSSATSHPGPALCDEYNGAVPLHQLLAEARSLLPGMFLEMQFDGAGRRTKVRIERGDA